MLAEARRAAVRASPARERRQREPEAVDGFLEALRELDVKATFFPQPNRDNFGETVNFIEYDWTWNIGDRTSLFSSGWFDPHPDAGRAWELAGQRASLDAFNAHPILRMRRR